MLDRSVTPGVRYAYAVRARNAFGTSGTSAPATARAAVLLPRVALTAVLSSTTTTVGHSVLLSGRTSSRAAGVHAYRQGWYGGAWHTWATTLVSATGTYRFVITPTVKATNYYRVALPATAAHPGAVSRTVTLVVS